MNPDTLFDWVKLFGTLSAPEGANRAHEVVALLNQALLRYQGRMEAPAVWSENWRTAIARLPVQPTALALPWRAYHLSQANCSEADARVFAGGVRAILATIPQEYQLKSLLVGAVSLDVDSVLDCMASLIRSASKSLTVAAPYWRVQGIEHLKRRTGPLRATGLRVTVVTGHPLSVEDQAGCAAFKHWLADAGAQVQHFTPRPLTTGERPLPHLKLLVADNAQLYLGSANFTDFGLNRSIEMGLWLEGGVVAHANEVVSLLMTQMEMIPENHNRPLMSPGSP